MNSSEYQKEVLRIIKKYRYRINIQTGTISSYRRKDDAWIPKKYGISGNLPPRVYISSGSRDDQALNAQVHVIVWLKANGEFDEEYTIRHKDGNMMNNCIQNLECIQKYVRKKKAVFKVARPKKVDQFPFENHRKNVRFNDIQWIREFLEKDPGMSVKEMASRIKCNYGSTRYAMKAIREGIPLKYETAGPYLSPNNKINRWAKKVNSADFHLHPDI